MMLCMYAGYIVYRFPAISVTNHTSTLSGIIIPGKGHTGMSTNEPHARDDIHAVLNAGERSPRQRGLRWLVTALVVLLLAGSVLLWLLPGNK
jgi:hypothetical protein